MRNRVASGQAQLPAPRGAPWERAVGDRRPRQASDEQLRCDVHDRIGPGVTSLALRLALLEESLSGLHPADSDSSGSRPAGSESVARQAVARLRREAEGLVEELYRVVHGEPPELLGQVGLAAAVQQAATLAAAPGLSVRVRVVGAAREPSAAVAQVLYRAALEGTANVARHARARRCQVTLRLGDDHAALEVRDDGVGMRARRRGRARHGLGIASLRRAARRLGGEVHLLALPRGGTSLTVRLPSRAATHLRRSGRRSRHAAPRGGASARP